MTNKQDPERKDKRNGKIYFGENDFEVCCLTEDHPLEFLAEKLDGHDSDCFYEQYMSNRMICTYKKDVLHGLIEVFNEDGYLILSGNFKEGYAEGKWKIYHENENIDASFESEWKKGKLISPYFYNASEFYYYDYYYSPPTLTKDTDGESWNISHDIWGYWSNYADPLPTFNVTYKIKGKHLIQRKIIQYPFWGEEETEISVESFDKNGALRSVKLHELIKKHSAYQEPLRFKEWIGYDDDNSAEVLMVRTIDLLEAHEIKGKYEDEFKGHYDFGYGLKILSSSPFVKANNPDQTFKEMCYFAWGNQHGVSIEFGANHKIKKLKCEGKTLIWDIENGLNVDFQNKSRKNIKDVMQNGEPTFETKII